jgi:predicted outer membrane protein
MVIRFRNMKAWRAPVASVVLTLPWVAWVAGISHTTAQPARTVQSPQTGNAETFLRLAHSFAVLQARAAEFAASRDTRPEVRSFARRMVEFRREQITRLLATARERTIAVSPIPEFEHRIVLENLEPLDFLALSRRYAEIQVQALEHELQGYTSGEAGSDEGIKALAHDTRPHLQRLLEEARQVRQAVGP